MKILVRLPNWLGDVVMSCGFLKALQHHYPKATIGIIVKKGLEELVPYLPVTGTVFVFNKKEHGGLIKSIAFGRKIKKAFGPEIFFSLPDSFSSAWIGYHTGARKRVGYKKEGRRLLLTHAYKKEEGLHRVTEYKNLFYNFSATPAHNELIWLKNNHRRQEFIVVSINSEAQSRRLTVEKAVAIIEAAQKEVGLPVTLIGAPKEAAFVAQVYSLLKEPQGVQNMCGKTNLAGLTELLASAAAMISTDSGPAHLANALGTPVVVLFGAGNEQNTAPYNADWVRIVRLNKLSCEPCTKNICQRYPVPQCLQQLDEQLIVQALKNLMATVGKSPVV